MDIRTYDEAERRARESVAAWQLLRLFSPVTFDKSEFPTRAGTLYDLLPLLDAMHGGRMADFVRERGGFGEDDVDAIANALACFVEFHRRTFGGPEALLPITSMVSQYLIYTKIQGFPKRARVLEIGSGCGYLSFFLASDPAVERYDKIEITQSLYVLQALVDAHCYGGAFENRALRPPQLAQVGLLRLEGSQLFSTRTTVTVSTEPRSVLHPWWRIDDALTRSYDVITANANLAEMRYGALVYYLTAIKRCLADEGVLVIQCLGSQGGGVSRPTVIKTLQELGFRPLVLVAGPHDGKHFALDNLLLIGPRHPDYQSAPASFDSPAFLSDHPLVRSIYGLDRPPGSSVSGSDFVKATVKRLPQKSSSTPV
jgi:hypothetical protein